MATPTWTAPRAVARRRVDFVRLATWVGVAAGCGAFWTAVIRAIV